MTVMMMIVKVVMTEFVLLSELLGSSVISKVVPRRPGPLLPAAWGFLRVPPPESEFLRVGPDNPHGKRTLQVIQGPKPSASLAPTLGTLPQPHFPLKFLLPPRNFPPPLPSLPWIFLCGSLSNSEV